MEPFPFYSDKFDESLIELYRKFYSWLWRKISAPFSKKGKTTDRISSDSKVKDEERESLVKEEHYEEIG